MQSLIVQSLLAATAATGIAGAWLLLRGLWGPRLDAARRCPRCGYDRQAVAGLRCPECGRLARSERSLHPRRRSWRRVACGAAFLGVAGLLAAGGWIAGRSGWTSITPTTGLILAVAVTGDDDAVEALGLAEWREASPVAALPPWQRSMLRAALLARIDHGLGAQRTVAASALYHVLPTRANIGSDEIALLRTLAADREADVRGWALLMLAERLEAPETDPMIRSVLDDATCPERVRWRAQCGLLSRHGGFSRSPADVPSDALIDAIIQWLPDSGLLGATAAKVAEQMARDKRLNRRLVEPLMARAQSEPAQGRAGAVMVAAWRHAGRSRPPQLDEALVELAASAGPGDFRSILELAQSPEAGLPAQQRLSLLQQAIEHGDPGEQTMARSLREIVAGESSAGAAR